MVYIYVTSGLLEKKTLEVLLKTKSFKDDSEVVFSSDGTSALG